MKTESEIRKELEGCKKLQSEYFVKFGTSWDRLQGYITAMEYILEVEKIHEPISQCRE